jgi:hypothetical protein
MSATEAGDLETLRAHELSVERVELEREPAEAVHALTDRIKGLLDRS